MEHSLYLTGLRGATITTYMKFVLEWFSIEFCKTKTKQIDYKLDYLANLKP